MRGEARVAQDIHWLVVAAILLRAGASERMHAAVAPAISPVHAIQRLQQRRRRQSQASDCFARRLSHLPVESDERFHTPALQQQRQPHASVQSVRVPHHCVAGNWHTQNEKPVRFHESLHFTHGAQVAVGVNRVAVSTEPVVLEVGYGNHEIERRPLRACAAVSARWVMRMTCRRLTVVPFCICEGRERRVVPIQRVVPSDVRTEAKSYVNNVVGAYSMTVT